MKRRNWFWGLFFVGAAGAIIINKLELFDNINPFRLILTALLIPVIINGCFSKSFSGIIFPIAILCIIYAKPLNIEQLAPWPILFSALFATIGLSILFKKTPFQRIKGKVKKKLHSFENSIKSKDEVFQNENQTFHNCSVSFGSSSKFIRTDCLERADISCSFGALKVYFAETTLSPDGADIYVDCSFSGVELYIPRDWNIKEDSVSVALSAINVPPHTHIPNAPELRLHGKVSFGAIDILYI